jgi:hypothetical protein
LKRKAKARAHAEKCNKRGFAAAYCTCGKLGTVKQQKERERLRFARRPGSTYRVLAHAKDGDVELKNRGVFDELVVDHWFHLEQMTTRSWWARIGDARINVEIATNGDVDVLIERGEYGPKPNRGET